MMRSIASHINVKPGVLKLLALLFWLIIWQAAAAAVDNILILPGPWQTVTGAVHLLAEIANLKTICITLIRVFGGVFFSVFLGLICGFLSFKWMCVNLLLKPFVTVIRTLPVVSISILLNLWFQSGWVPLCVTFFVCFPIAYTNILEGAENTDTKLIEMAHVYQVSFFRIIKDIYIPFLKPYAAAALISAIGMGWKATVTAEVLANALPSMGMELYYAKIYLETETLFSWTFIVVVFSFLIEKATVFALKEIKSGDRYGN